MKKDNYDELQMSIRYKTAAQCLGIIFLLTFVNGFVNEEFVWAPPITQSLVIIMITTTYFIVMTTLKGAYISNKEKNPLFTVICFGILAIVSFIGFVGGFSRMGMDYLVKDKMLASSSGTIFMTIFWTVCSLINLYKFLKNRNMKEDCLY